MQLAILLEMRSDHRVSAVAHNRWGYIWNKRNLHELLDSQDIAYRVCRWPNVDRLETLFQSESATRIPKLLWQSYKTSVKINLEEASCRLFCPLHLLAVGGC